MRLFILTFLFSQINCLDFAADNRGFVSCANETGIRVFDIQDNSNVAAITINAGHADNIKKVAYLNEHLILSGSADRTVKLWDLRNTEAPVSSLTLDKPVEDFCLRANTQ